MEIISIDMIDIFENFNRTKNLKIYLNKKIKYYLKKNKLTCLLFILYLHRTYRNVEIVENINMHADEDLIPW